jgi:hypothetical protein
MMLSVKLGLSVVATRSSGYRRVSEQPVGRGGGALVGQTWRGGRARWSQRLGGARGRCTRKGKETIGRAIGVIVYASI